MKLNTRLWSIAGLFLTFFLTMHAVAETVYRVKSFDTLNRVVKKFYPNNRSPKAQIMVAILAKNPRAFKGGNINFLLKGKRLKLPSKSEINQISSTEAQQLLSQHAQFFRSGISGNLPIPTLNGKNDRKKALAVVKEQTQKITKLEKESDSLKTQLDNLFKQKQIRDKELVELEQQIKQFSGEAANTGISDVTQVEKSNQRLKETNAILQQKLIESKSEIAENTRSTITLERKLNNLQEKIQQDNDGTVDTEAPAVSTKNSLPTPASISSQQVSTNSPIPSGSDNTSNNSKFFWLLPLLLLATFLLLLWLLARWFFGRSKKVEETETDYEKDYATLIEEHESIDYLNAEDNDFTEESLEPSIKLDVARAYLEADDNESALNILEEIMHEGSDEQKKEAQELLVHVKSS